MLKNCGDLNIIYLVNGLINESISGSDIRVIEICKRLIQLGIKNITIITTNVGFHIIHDVHKLKVNYIIINIPSIFLKFMRMRSKFSKKLAIILTYIFVLFKTLRIRMPIKSKKCIIFPSSDFLFDMIPAYIQKNKFKNSIKLIAMIHHRYNLPTRRKGDFLSNFFGYISQRISLGLMRKTADNIFVYQSAEGRAIKNYLNKFGFNINRVSFVLNGTDIEMISSIKPRKKIYDACFVSELRVSKGIFDIPDIWTDVLNKAGEKAKLAIIGGGSLGTVNELKSHILDKNLSKNVKMLGWLPHGKKLFETMKMSKIYIMPSYEEGFGMSICEALACGLPVIAYDLPAYDVFENSIFKVPVANKETFAKAIVKLLCDDGLRKELSERGIKMSKRFDWNCIAEKEFKLFCKILSEKIE
jgi:glycosyltransferase involved in cell wall biosynthesis